MDLTLGQVVYSKAGRDKGKKFIVVEMVDDLYVKISDGDLRRIENPKLKKMKHLQVTGEIILPLKEKLENKARVSNAEIRKALEVTGDL
ncbi:KOW domain-containing RNA-binding protein [Acetivibrio clariflavus]|uniref:LSU ribosomal protein L14E n=1 Tax=Acetivibrio clariflavus (strain DSM 19732 / NBRC 101661 / EBR45) TaxID=720554 RepID=G8M2F0_ACECE|nr:KOW domain-containing RNA-binding protein [Acetivibrio clariflavus]AEV70320.1 LSU ribosomal protein L14E [Acetivibrio clariflavus DSM 19732]HOQ01334.1 KOW domain-containing RNA-binding protein [Acetivibrio clariflavus]HPU40865.1 KOW domain-containing RNA-binding protein [Acetivibrio clariflavus]